MTDAIEIIGQILLASYQGLFLPTMRFFPMFLVTSLAIAVAVHIYMRKRGYDVPKSFFAFAFPKKIWWHPSARLDYVFAVVNRAVMPFLALPIIFGPAIVAAPTHHFFADWLGLYPPPFHYGWGAVALHIALAALAADFGIFIVHYIQHRSRVLWEFHKVHHSAEVMTPVTVMRMHPADDLLTGASVALFLGIVYGLMATFFDGAPGIAAIYNNNVVFFLFYATAYHLRHSHVWLPYPVWLSKWLISPAQHQIHHSSEERHWDRNMGFIFAFWDRLFGTLYVPEKKEEFELGLNGAEHKDYNSLARLYFLPVRRAIKRLERRPLQATGCIAAVLTVLGIGLMPAEGEPVRPVEPPSLQLAELTWLEVEAAVEAGYRIAIVPTAGLEQNGPHMILGKHAHVISHTSLAIAERLGNALVAPVVDYVPEGDFDPPSGHMRFAGTIGVSEEAFEGILEGAARSLRLAGFELIAFVGDSGGNQDAQARIADRLNDEWGDKGARVLHVGDYYDANKQVAWLLAQGENLTAIGGHAGIRDTSEMLAIHPQGVREDWRRKFPNSKAEKLGLDGDPSRASQVRGKRMLDMKIEAAIGQIEAFAANLQTPS